jgi:hypothetical protein
MFLFLFLVLTFSTPFFSRAQSEQPINPGQLVVESSSPFRYPKVVASHNQLEQVQAMEIHSVTVADAKKQSEKNSNLSLRFELPLHPSTALPGQTKLPPTDTKTPLNPNLDHCLSRDQNHQPSSDIIPPENPLPCPLPDQNQQQQLSPIILPVNHLCSPSLSQSQKPTSHSASLLNPNAASPSTDRKRKSCYPLIPSPERLSTPCSKRKQPGLKCPLPSSYHKEVLEKEIPESIFDPMVSEESGSKTAKQLEGSN